MRYEVGGGGKAEEARAFHLLGALCDLGVKSPFVSFVCFVGALRRCDPAGRAVRPSIFA